MLSVVMVSYVRHSTDVVIKHSNRLVQQMQIVIVNTVMRVVRVISGVIILIHVLMAQQVLVVEVI